MKKLLAVLLILAMMATPLCSLAENWTCPVCGAENDGDFCSNDATPRTQSSASAVNIGEYVTFGTYPQGANGEILPIEWQVLDVQDGKALLISSYGLDAKPYNTEYAAVTWETCSLRAWLNNDFMNVAFSVDEQALIAVTDVDNSSSQHYSSWSTDGGNDTQDKVFLLSFAETGKYFDGIIYNTNARVEPTAYAIRQGAYTSNSNRTNSGAAAGFWWLRSPGEMMCYMAVVSDRGSLDSGYINNEYACVRPALWIDLSASAAGSDAAQENGTSAANDSAVIPSSVQVGDIITYGHYEQDNNLANGTEPIEWQVLDVQGGKALLISRYSLDSQSYHTEWGDITWEQCTLRTWLNNDFLNAAFTVEEQTAILLTDVDNSIDQCFDFTTVVSRAKQITGGNNTQDKIFLLSYAEANNYFDVQY